LRKVGRSLEKLKLLNTYISNVSMQEALDEVENMIYKDNKSYIVAVNVDVIVKMEDDVYLKTITDKADMVLADGQPLIWISKLNKHPIKAKISGSDLVPELCRIAAQRGHTIFILGGKEGVAEKAKKNLVNQYPCIQIVGTYAPPLGFETDKAEMAKITNMISKAHPDLLIVCLGCPKQEKFIYENIEHYNAKVSICAGATVDFLAGEVKRAPRWMSDHGLEWLYRFTQEPKRLFKRYFVDDMKIVKLAWKYRGTRTIND
jgi:N-acetylglucosaminyldiphosphoundecaprenol N-acetyl-beta-D-mannosaminyltransferase